MRPRVPPSFFSIDELLLPPNVVTATRFVIALLFPLAARSTSLALLFLVSAAGSDVLDGWLARRGDRITATGVVLDPIADKAFALSVVATLVAQRKLPVWGAPCLLLRELIEAPLLAWVFLHPSAPDEADVRLVGLSRPGKVATAAEFAAVLFALVLPSALTPLLLFAGAAGLAAGIGYWDRELSRK